MSNQHSTERIPTPSEISAPIVTPYHAKYFAHDLTRRSTEGMERLSMALFDAAVDLNPHQIEAAMFALKSPLSKGVLLADEVGLGKTIEAGIVLCQLWAERKRKLLVLCPASLRKQWALELEEKFNLPVYVLDAKAYREAQRSGNSPLDDDGIVVMSFPYANRLREELKAIAWDLVVIDEAHKLRNAYRPSNKIGQGIRWATEDCRKLLLTATPLQNSLMELYGLTTLIDERIFGDANSFRSQFTGLGSEVVELRSRLSTFCKRTLRSQVTEYIRYTERRPITRPFSPSDDEQQLYDAVSEFLQRPDSYALPKKQRHLTSLILRKLLASSSHAIAGTLEGLKVRLETMRDEGVDLADDFAERLIGDEEMEYELLDEVFDGDEAADDVEPATESPQVDRVRLAEEIETLGRLTEWARSIQVDAKTEALLTALEIGFEQMAGNGAESKALVFTESRRTQDYLKDFLESNGYAGKVVVFNGTNGGPEVTAIYEAWVAKNAGTGRASGSRAVDVRTALIEHFRDEGSIMLATEAAAEGVNIQFCSLVVNYDLPWNPQRIEQRIGRCHRYGQLHDVVVINFLNERNEADQRVLELLTEKFSLFSGIFGASDEVLGTIESGVDFEQRILAIYQECRTTAEIDGQFRRLQDEMDEHIAARMAETRKDLLEHFDEDVHERLKIELADAKAQLDRFGRRFWSVTKLILRGSAAFDESEHAFDLNEPPREGIPLGRYHLISKSGPEKGDAPSPSEAGAFGSFLYRLSHPLGEHVLGEAKALDTPPASITFDVSGNPTRLHLVEALKGSRGHLTLTRLAIDSYERDERLLFSGVDAAGQALDQETMEKLFACTGVVESNATVPEPVEARLVAESDRHVQAALSKALEQNSAHFNEARERLEKWADDLVLSAEKALRDTKEQIKALRRQARQATTIEEQTEIQRRTQQLEQQQRRQRREIFTKEDEIAERRDELIDSLERRLSQETTVEPLFTIAWSVK